MLVKKYEKNVLCLAWNILGNREEAEDVTQETFIQAYLSLNRFDTKRSFKNWLYSIAYKRCIDRKRKEKSFYKFVKKFIYGEKLRINIEKEGIEYSERFAPLLSKLNEKERTAIILKINEGYSAKEIAEVLNCAESTARVHLFNARRKLKKLLEEENV
ncbi:RNA polymerase sigma factor [Candidatus Aminicenantes bacterium AC-335-A11]|nr:RNA polymerase sigma factor [Candidatus Aminicenantes bacterium AC-335-A11]